MKTIIIALLVTLGAEPSFGAVQFYLGLQGGAGVMLTRDQLNNLGTSSGFVNATSSNSS